MLIKTNSKEVKPGDIFIAIKGNKVDGHDYIEEAIQNGAKEIIAERGKYSVKTKIVKNTYQYLINQLHHKYYKDIKHIKLIGITGTNGKTTCAYLLNQSLNKLGIPSAYIGTIGFYKKEKIKDLKNTTPDILELYNILEDCKDCQYVIMEVSSQALSMNRTDGLKFDIAALTNITQDHLDYHKTMDNYAKSKVKLFKNLRHQKIALINTDSAYKNYFILKGNHNYLYGSNGDYKISDIKMDKNITTFKLNDTDYQMNLIGRHNIYNMAVCISILKLLKINEETIKKIVSELEEPSGRLEYYNYKNNLIFIDYAHTPDAVLNVIKAVRELNPRKIITLIGCGGNRDKAKRPIMASIACNNSDYCIFTSDNPRGEKAIDIIKDMVNNIDNKNYQIILNREKAIKKAIQKLRKNDILLVLGKGHETYQIIGDKILPFDDKKIVLKYI